MKDIGLLLLLQLILPQVIALELMLHDVHAQSADLVVRDEAMELGETNETRQGWTDRQTDRQRERERPQREQQLGYSSSANNQHLR